MNSSIYLPSDAPLCHKFEASSLLSDQQMAKRIEFAAFEILSKDTRRCFQESQEASKVKHKGSSLLDRSFPAKGWKGRRKGLLGVS